MNKSPYNNIIYWHYIESNYIFCALSNRALFKADSGTLKILLNKASINIIAF